MEDTLLIGKVIGSKEHFRYQVSVYAEGEVAPLPHEPSLGEFVSIGNRKNRIFGLITSTYLLSEENMGLYRFSKEDMKIFTPELINDPGYYLVVNGIGQQEKNWMKTGIPTKSPELNDPVYLMSDHEIRSLHLSRGELSIEYLPPLLSSENPEIKAAVTEALRKLSHLLTEHREVINLLRSEMEWNNKVRWN